MTRQKAKQLLTILEAPKGYFFVDAYQRQVPVEMTVRRSRKGTKEKFLFEIDAYQDSREYNKEGEVVEVIVFQGTATNGDDVRGRYEVGERTVSGSIRVFLPAFEGMVLKFV
ncbi:MAG: hypothetical protein WCJ29_02210 [bacterium]